MLQRLATAALLALLGCSSTTSPEDDPNQFSVSLFVDPPAEFGPQARWWWPGASVDEDGITEELRRLSGVGYSAVEIQPFMSAMTNAALAEDSRIRAVGDDTFLSHLNTAACFAQELGMSWDLTLGSGWSTGGPDIGENGSRQLVSAELDLTGPSTFSDALPTPTPPDWIDNTNSILPAVDGFDTDLSLVAVLGAELIGNPDAEPVTLGEIVSLDSNVNEGTLSWQVPAGSHRVFAIYENLTQHFPVANAYPGALEDARIIDHLDRRGIDAFLSQEFVTWIDAVAECPPEAVFVDSYELVAELPWTTRFGTKFEDSVGYDLTPVLPFLFLDGGESEYTTIFGEPPPRYQSTTDLGARAREDYEAFRAALFADEMVGILRDWLATRGIALRLQAHGGYADVLDAYALSDIPESEGLYGGGSYDFLRLAASATEVSGRRFASSETLVSVGSDELSEREARLLIGRAFSAGINRLVYHGHSYRYDQPGGERWYPFRPLEDSAATTGPLDLSFDLRPDSAFFAALPAINLLVTRLSYALSRGTAVNQIAWLYADRGAENFPNSGVEPGAFESEISQALRGAGYNYTRISRSALTESTSVEGALDVGAASFDALVVDDLTFAEPELLEAIERAADAEVPILWLGELPERAPGLQNAAERDAAVANLIGSLESTLVRLDGPSELPEALEDAGIAPTLRPVDADELRFSIARRQVAGADLYFVFNESFQSRTETLGIVGAHGSVTLLNPDTGEVVESTDGDRVTLELGPARSAVVVVERAN